MKEYCRRWKSRVTATGLACIVLLVVLPGCTKVVPAPSEGEAPPAITTIREFPDVPIPEQLTLDERESFVYQAPGLATGLMVYNGNVEYDSLVRFFDQNLTGEGWLRCASLKYPRTLLLYRKTNRFCLVTMKTKTMNVRVEIWVAPVDTLFYEDTAS
ncbi:MAG: hypothetical protein ACLFVT_05505 [Syntrophobacteria bacterium]